MNNEEIIQKVKNAGVVGAGGGGFPTYVKISASVDNLIANGAECEPLLFTDKYLMEIYAGEIVEGLRYVMQTTGAKNVYIALKKKYGKAINEFNKIIGASSNIELFLIENYYPAGDEQELVYNITGNLVPEGGIPLDVGTVVINVNSLLNVFRAVENEPVTKRWLTVAGELEEPYITAAPVGISVGELIDAAKPKLEDYKILIGGPMMGRIIERDFRITKLCGGVIVLSPDHPVVVKHAANIKVQSRRGKSICDQCYDCTIVCPRHLLGHDLFPHKIMRSLFIAPGNSMTHLTNAYLCSECGLCDMFACPLELSPRDLLINAKNKLREQKIANPYDKSSGLTVHPERNFRRVDSDRLMTRIGVKKYDLNEYGVKNITCKDVSIALSQHAGLPAKPVVKTGQQVKTGDLIAEISGDSMGANIHSGIDGIVADVNDRFINVKSN